MAAVIEEPEIYLDELRSDTPTVKQLKGDTPVIDLSTLTPDAKPTGLMRSHKTMGEQTPQERIALAPLSKKAKVFITEDLPNLAQTFGARIGGGIEQGIGGIQQFVGEIPQRQEAMYDGYSIYGDSDSGIGAPTASEGARKGRELSAEGRMIAQTAEQEKPLATRAGRIVGSAVESIGQQIPGIGATVLTGSPAVGLGMMGAQTFGQTYAEGRANGQSPEDATKNALIQGGTEVATETLPFLKLAKFMKPGKLSRKVGEYLLAEVPGEHIATAVQNTTGKYFDEKDPTKRAKAAVDYFFSQEHTQDQIDTFFTTLVQGAVMTGTAAAVHKVGGQQADPLTQMPPQEQPITPITPDAVLPPGLPPGSPAPLALDAPQGPPTPSRQDLAERRLAEARGPLSRAAVTIPVTPGGTAIPAGSELLGLPAPTIQVSPGGTAVMPGMVNDLLQTQGMTPQEIQSAQRNIRAPKITPQDSFQTSRSPWAEVQPFAGAESQEAEFQASREVMPSEKGQEEGRRERPLNTDDGIGAPDVVIPQQAEVTSDIIPQAAPEAQPVKVGDVIPMAGEIETVAPVSATGIPVAEGKQGVAVQGQAKQAEAVSKQPWQMTRGEYLSQGVGEDKPSDYLTNKKYQSNRDAGVKAHKAEVYKASRSGKPIPAEVLAEYPDFQGEKAAPPTTPQPEAKPAEPAPSTDRLRRIVEGKSPREVMAYLKKNPATEQAFRDAGIIPEKATPVKAGQLVAQWAKGQAPVKLVDPAKDDILKAISKLGGIDFSQIEREWGKTISDSYRDFNRRGVFGKPVVRKNNGRTIDNMVQALAQYGYLPLDENGKASSRDLFDRLRTAAGGEKVFSTEFDFTPVELEEAGYNDLTPQAQDAVDAILSDLETMTPEELAQNREELFSFFDEVAHESTIQGNAAETSESAEGRAQASGTGSQEPAEEKVRFEKTAAGDQAKLFATPPTFGKKPVSGKAVGTGELLDSFTPDKTQNLWDAKPALNLTQTPSGRYTFVGKVPASLQFVDTDGSTPSDAVLKEIQQSSNPALSMKSNGVKGLSFATPEEAAKAAMAAGYEVKGTAEKTGSTAKEEPERYQGKVNTKSEAFKKWFGDSKVVDENGNPLVVYHGTYADFGEFSKAFTKGQLGFHFGTKDAVDEIFDRGDFNGESSGANAMPVYLSMANPLRLQDLGAWQGRDVVAMVNDTLGAKLHSSSSDAAIRNEIIKAGYDGVVYKNEFEDAGGEADSYIAFSPTQIKSVFNRGTFDRNDPNIIAEAQQAQYNEGHEEQIYTVSSVHEPPAGTGGSKAARTGMDQLALFTTEGTPTPEAAQVAKANREIKTFAKVANVVTGHIKTGVDTITSPQDVAHLTAAIRKKSQETLLVVIADKNGKVLGVLDHSTGTASQSLASVGLVLGGAEMVEGAEKLWIVHNHPSGDSTLSPEDLNIFARIKDASRDTGLSAEGIMALGEKNATFHDGYGEQTFPIPAKARTKSVPHLGVPVIVKRTVSTSVRLTSPDLIRPILRKIGATGEGVLLLNTKNQAAAFIPMNAAEMSRLRTGEKGTGASLLRKVMRETNSSAMIAVTADAVAGRNVGSFAEAHNARILDIYNPDAQQSASETGQLTSNGPTFYDITSVVPLALKELARIGKAGREALPHLITVARSIYKEGMAYRQFVAKMKEKLADLWETFKGYGLKLYRTMKDERGLFAPFGGDIGTKGQFSDLTDRKAKVEIDDSGAKLKKSAWYEDGEVRGEPMRKMVGTLGDTTRQLSPEMAARLGYAETKQEGLLQHPTLFKDAPLLADVRVEIRESAGYPVAAQGHYTPGKNEIYIEVNPELGGNALSSLLHEVQHATQERGDFAKGGSPADPYSGSQRADLISSIAKELESAEMKRGNSIPAKELYKRAESIVDSAAGRQKRYNRLAGEEEARRTSSRSDMTAAERMGRPYDKTDIGNRDDLIVKMEGGVSEYRQHLDSLREGVTGTIRNIQQSPRVAGFVASIFKSDKNLSAWMKTVGTMYHTAEMLAKKGKYHFKAVFEKGQDYLGDVSAFAVAAEQEAPTLFRKTSTVIDALKSLHPKEVLSPQYRADMKAIAAPLYEGTLWGGADPTKGRVWSDETLRKNYGLSDHQITMYRESLAAANQSLEDLSKSIIAKNAETVQMSYDRTLSLQEMADDVLSQIEERKGDMEAMLADAKETYKEDLKAFVETVKDKPDKARQLKKFRDKHESFLKAQEAGVETLDGAKRSVEDVVNKSRTLMEHGYFPLMRFGRFTVTVRDAQGEVLYFGMHQSETRSKIEAEILKKEFPGADVTTSIMSKEAHKLFDGMSADAVQLFAEHLDKEESAAYQEYLKKAMNNRSSMKRLIKRKGTEGYSQDVLRTLASFITSNARRTSGNYHLAGMRKLVDAIPESDGDIKDYAVKLWEYLQSSQEEASGIRAFLFFQYIGGSIASAISNLTQPVLMTAPALAEHTDPQTVVKQMNAAFMQSFSDPAKVRGDIGKALRRAEREGITAPQEIYQLTAIASDRLFASHPGWNAGMKAWGSFFSLAETMNRRQTFLAAYQIARDNGKSDADAFAFGATMVKATQGVYNRGNRPVASRGALGAVVFTFKQFSIMYLELLKRLPVKQRAIMIGLLWLAVGGEGLPFYEDAADLLDTLGQWLGYATNTKRAVRDAARKHLGESGSKLVLDGLNGWLPIDLQTRIGFGNLIPGTAMLKQSELDKSRDTREIVGPIGGLYNSVTDALQLIAEGRPWRAAKELSPRAVQSVLTGLEMAVTGKSTDKYGRKVADASPVDSVAKMAGFTPKKQAEASQIKSALLQDKNLLRVHRDRYMNMIVDGYLSRDQDQVLQARQEMAQWNTKNPELRIEIRRQDIQRRIEAARVSNTERFLKGLGKTQRRQAMQELQ